MQQHSFGYWLKRRRKAFDLTQAELANQVGCSSAAIRKIEAEERRPSAQVVERLADVFDIPQDERTAFLRFARGSWRYAPGETKGDTLWQVSTRIPRSNLPTPITSLVGRGREIAEIRDYLLRTEVRLITLIGPPGVGKTRLSIEAGRAILPEFPDGVFFVALAPLEDPSLLVLTIAQALGYVKAMHQPASNHLKEGIGDKQMLIVLDNCEHLIEDVASLASSLLSACPRLKILATSRESLRISGEWIYGIPALDVPKESSSVAIETVSEFPALSLFAERARAVRSDFMLHADNIQAVASICAQLDGLPLAIELIAARMRLMTPQALLEHLNSQFVLSADGMRSTSTRQKTLNDAIGWSYNLFSEEEQRLFTYLSVFSGGFTLKAAESIFSGMFTPKPVSDLIISLLDKSLLQRKFDAGGGPRFDMLVTIQQFALGHLRSIDEESKVRSLHFTYFLDLAEQADREIHGPNQIGWMDRLEKEVDNFRAALDWCISEQNTEAALRLLGALGWIWFVQDRNSEMRYWFDQVRALPEIGSFPALYARLLNQIGQLSWLSMEHREALSVLDESRAIWQKLGADGEQGLAEALNFQGMVERSIQADYKTSQFLFERSFELYQKHKEQWGMAFVLCNLGINASERKDEASAHSMLQQSLDLFRQLGDLWGLAISSQWLGELFVRQENYEKARFLFTQQLLIHEELKFKQGITIALLNLGKLDCYQSDYVQAGQHFQKSLSISDEYSLKWEESLAYYHLGLLALYRNHYERTAQYFRDYHSLYRKLNEVEGTTDLLYGLAAVAAGMDRSERAARLYGVVQAILETGNNRIPPIDRAEFDRHIQIAREQLGEAAFDTLAVEGRAMTMEQAIVYALEKSDG